MIESRIRGEVRARLARLELPFNRDGVDPYGISRRHLEHFFTMLAFFHRRYFHTSVRGTEHIPPRGRAMLVGNHSGGYAIDAGMVIASCFLDMEPPRLAQGMADKFINRLAFASQWSNKTGQFTGLPEHAVRLLEDERLLMVFPEGHAGTAKLFHERYSMVRFGTGFMRLALQTKTPIIPFGFAGGGEAVPTVANLYRLGRLFGVPYVPLTPWIVPVPLPVKVAVRFGPAMRLDGTGNEDDAVIGARVELVEETIERLVRDAREGASA